MNGIVVSKYCAYASVFDDYYKNSHLNYRFAHCSDFNDLPKPIESDFIILFGDVADAGEIADWIDEKSTLLMQNKIKVVVFSQEICRRMKGLASSYGVLVLPMALDVPTVFNYLDSALSRKWLKEGCSSFLSDERLMSLFIPSLQNLTQREVQVAECIGLGLNNREISNYMGVNQSTVKVHITSILKKLKARNRTAVAALLFRMKSI